MQELSQSAASTFSTPPPPLDSPNQTDPLACPPLRWGILGCGRVSNDFCLAIKRHVPTASLVACATGDNVDRAQAFASSFSIPSAYGDYASLVADPSVQIIYVGTVHSFRRQIGEMCLLAGKHVLLEKPFACKVEDAEYLIQLAKDRCLFLQEGMWTRFFPAVEMARQIVMHQKVLGEVASVMTDFNFNAADSEVYPDSFVYQRKLGGGASLLVGPYPIAAVSLFFGDKINERDETVSHRRPDKVLVAGQVDKLTGVDLQASIALQFAATGIVSPALDPTNPSESTPKLPGAGIATMSYGMLCESEEITTVIGTKGRLTIHSPCHCPTRLTVQYKGQGRGNATQVVTYDFALPLETPEVLAATIGEYQYPNSVGFAYEAAAVARCIAAGLLCCPQYTLEETMIAQHILEQARQQLGVKDVDAD